MKSWTEFSPRGKATLFLLLILGIPFTLFARIMFGKQLDAGVFIAIGFAMGVSAMMWVYEQYGMAKQ